MKSYGHVRALDGVDLTMPAGSIFGFLGPNGAGKTTTIKVLLGSRSPTSGRCAIYGTPVERFSAESRREVGYLAQDPVYPKWMTGREVLEFVGALLPRVALRRRSRARRLRARRPRRRRRPRLRRLLRRHAPAPRHRPGADGRPAPRHPRRARRRRSTRSAAATCSTSSARCATAASPSSTRRTSSTTSSASPTTSPS